MSVRVSELKVRARIKRSRADAKEMEGVVRKETREAAMKAEEEEEEKKKARKRGGRGGT